MFQKLAVVAIGGNSLIQDPTQADISHQWDAVRETTRQIAEMVAQGWRVVITHGNGPQVGHNLRRVELGQAEGLHDSPLDLIVAETQGSIGYMLQQAMSNSLRRIGINRTVMSVVTQVRVDETDSAFDNPSKPIGSFMSAEQADTYRAQGWQIKEDAGRGYRRVVASPKPLEIIEIRAIRKLVDEGFVVITVGGGGVPVIRNERGSLRGIPAVIDKDSASSLLAQGLGADLFIISTSVEQVALHFNTPQQHNLSQISHVQALKHLKDGHFASGSMQPKIQAVIDFIRNGGPQAIITNPPNLIRALKGETGTIILAG